MATCPCNEPRPFWCDILSRMMGMHQAHLCRTRPDYRKKWERDRDGREGKLPVAPAWLTCRFRGEQAGTLPSSVTGVGCATWETPFYRCRAYRQPVLIRAAASHLPRIAEALPGFDGRVCERCEACLRTTRALDP